MGKKKATGMSKRLGFTDRATIAENKDILRYNERLEREAKGLPPEEPRRGRGGRDGRPGRPSAGARPERAGRGDRPAGGRTERAPRPPRPAALDDEQRAVLENALAASVGETGLEPAGNALITRLAAHDSFERASGAGWDIAAGGHAAERTEQEWALLRKTWLTLRLALLESYVTIKPELEPTLARERKLVARLDKPARRGGRRPRAGKPSGDSRASNNGSENTDKGEKTGESRRHRPKRPVAGTPSPADVARKLAAPTDAATVAGADAAAALATEIPSSSDDTTADLAAEVAPEQGRAVADELRAEHGSPPIEADEAPDGDQAQLNLDL